MLSMGEGKRLIFDQGPGSQFKTHGKEEDQWVVMEGDDCITLANNTASSSSSTSSSINGDSTISNGSSSSSLDTTDDAISSSSASYDSNGSLYDLSDLMAQLPIKRGLSKYYQGKSQSFTSLSRVTSIEDLAKKETPYARRKMKSCKSHGGGLDTYKAHTLPKPIISKKNSRGSLSSSSFLSRRPSFASVCRLPLVPVREACDV